MRYTLKDYQADAVGDTRARACAARDFFRSASKRVSSVALAATTGAGKTVMAAAVIEALFWGATTTTSYPTPMLSCCGSVTTQRSTSRRSTGWNRPQTGSATGSSPSSIRSGTRSRGPGNVYFLNTSKLSRNSLLVRGADNTETRPASTRTPTPSPSPSGTRAQHDRGPQLDALHGPR